MSSDCAGRSGKCWESRLPTIAHALVRARHPGANRARAHRHQLRIALESGFPRRAHILHVLCGLGGSGRAEVAGYDMQSHVDAGSESTCCSDVAVIHESRSAPQLDLRKLFGERIPIIMM